MILSNFRVEERPMSTLFKLEDRCINMQDKYITMVKGDTLSFGVEIEDESGSPVDITDAEFIAKKNYDDAMSIFDKTLGSGITRVSAGLYTVRVAPADTADAEAGRYFYQFKVIKGSDVFTIMRGIIELEPEIEEDTL
jgi:hypothetical protein